MALTLDAYSDQKTKGLITMFKVDPKNVAIGTPRWNPHTGEQVDSELTTFNIESIDADIAKAETALAALRTLRADVATILGVV